MLDYISRLTPIFFVLVGTFLVVLPVLTPQANEQDKTRVGSAGITLFGIAGGMIAPLASPVGAGAIAPFSKVAINKIDSIETSEDSIEKKES